MAASDVPVATIRFAEIRVTKSAILKRKNIISNLNADIYKTLATKKTYPF